MPTSVVPWFSKQEFKETYHLLNHMDVKSLKEARDNILVWQARVEKLPLGIDITLPLLEAKIMVSDRAINESIKAVFMATAIQRFVTAVLKLPQARYYKTQSMLNLAMDIGLPMYLVDIRNEIIHGHGGWSGGDTLLNTINNCNAWASSFYWNPEYSRIVLEKDVATEFSEETWQTFMANLNKYGEYLMDSKGNKKSEGYFKAQKDFMESLMKAYPDSGEQCTEAVVSHLLLRDHLPPSEDTPKPGSVQQVCGCMIEYGIIAGVKPVLSWIASVEETVETILSCLIKKGKENPESVLEWVYVIVGSVVGLRKIRSPNSMCTHQRHAPEFEQRQLDVKWNKVVVELMMVEEKWASDMASRLMECTETGFTEDQKEKLNQLLSFLMSDEKSSSKSATKSVTDHIHTVDDVIAQAQSSTRTDTLEELQNSIFSSKVEPSGGTPLGVLPHQKGRTDLYKDFILEFPVLEPRPRTNFFATLSSKDKGQQKSVDSSAKK